MIASSRVGLRGPSSATNDAKKLDDRWDPQDGSVRRLATKDAPGPDWTRGAGKQRGLAVGTPLERAM